MADVRISELTYTDQLSDGDVIPIVRSGATYKIEPYALNHYPYMDEMKCGEGYNGQTIYRQYFMATNPSTFSTGCTFDLSDVDFDVLVDAKCVAHEASTDAWYVIPGFSASGLATGGGWLNAIKSGDSATVVLAGTWQGCFDEIRLTLEYWRNNS